MHNRLNAVTAAATGLTLAAPDTAIVTVPTATFCQAVQWWIWCRTPYRKAPKGIRWVRKA